MLSTETRNPKTDQTSSSADPEKPLHVDETEGRKTLGLGRFAWYQGLQCGSIPSIKIGRKYVIPRAMWEEFLRTGRVRA